MSEPQPPQSTSAEAEAEGNPAEVPQDKPIENKNGVDTAETTNTSSSLTDSTPSSHPSPSKAPAASTPSKQQPGPFVYDPNKITLKFIFANRDGVNVILECNPSDTVGEVKGALLSMWPKEMTECSGGDKIRLICMGKGMLSPDTKTINSFDVPIFKTHPTPVNVAVRPENIEIYGKKGSPNNKSLNPSTSGGGGGRNNSGSSGAGGQAPGSSGCSCSIM